MAQHGRIIVALLWAVLALVALALGHPIYAIINSVLSLAWSASAFRQQVRKS